MGSDDIKDKKSKPEKKHTLKIRTRLAMAFIMVILTPLLLIGGGGILYANFQIKAIEKYYNIDTEGIISFSDTTLFLNMLTQDNYTEIVFLAQSAPERLEDKDVLNDINLHLQDKYSFLVVMKNDAIIYDGSSGETSGIMSILYELSDRENLYGNGYYIGGKYLIKQEGFMSEDGSEGNAFIITRIERMLPEVSRMLKGMAIVVLAGMAITAMLMTAWIYRSIFFPLKKLQKATHEIREGNLDYSLNDISNNEIGELCQDFESMRERLRENALEKLKYDQENRELISNISHDLKTPITAIKGYVEGIMDGVADTPEKMDRYIRTIYNKAMDMDRLIEELTFYSKIDANRIPYSFDKVNVERYFRDCVEELAIDLGERGISMKYSNEADESIVIIADPEQLRKVINNIVGNSTKYLGDKKGHISIHISDAGDFVQIDIADNGKGIAQKDLPYIFERFYRTDASRNSMQGGSGIGLSIVRKIVEDHGGKIWALSKEGEGTTMCMVFRKYEEVKADEQNIDS
ncbi:MAG: HAMP domain-containing histidine kinase [Lachnospiraceae bacterium]|nr:HAMP domain-containing histidine kinase [Lachnospiraceae bacterium]